ncbi:MAG: orotate phosphoribosyltransferase [Spirochaetes bacterium]|nr:orotate phosphoribosyltransferase [Spirochaetota bacterium]
MQNSRDRLFNILYTKAFRYSDNPPFTLTSGAVSPYYFDCKTATLDPEGCTLIGELIFSQARDFGIDAAGGLTLGADPISLSLSLEAFKNNSIIYPLIVRKEPKKHGTQKWIEGSLDKVKKAMAIDDVITTGKSTIQAIEKLRESGLSVDKAFVIIDREEGGKANIEKLGVEVFSLFKRSDFDAERLKKK